MIKMAEEKEIGRFRLMLEELEQTKVDFYNYEKFVSKANTAIVSIQEMIRNYMAVIKEDKEEIMKVVENPKVKTTDWSDSLWFRLFNIQKNIADRYEEQIIAAMSILIEFQEMIIEKAGRVFESIRDVSEEKIKAETTKEIYDDIKQMFLDLRTKDRELYENIIKDIMTRITPSAIDERLDRLERKFLEFTENGVRGDIRNRVDNELLSKVSSIEDKIISRKKEEKEEHIAMPKKEKNIEGFREHLIERAKRLYEEGKSVKHLRGLVLATETKSGYYSRRYGLTREEIERIIDEVLSNASLYTNTTQGGG